MEKRRCIEPAHPKLSIKRQWELTGLPRATYYRGEPVVAESAENPEPMQRID